jgi:mannose-6-phosphate isomerase-like protein (cupin superfamily)
MSIAEIIVLGPGEGKTVSVLGDQYTFKAVGRETGGAYGLVEITAPAASSGPPPHIHEGEDEAFYVLEGELKVRIGERTMQAISGSFAFVPRGTIHTFSNPGSKPAKALVIVSPAGFEKAFEEMAEVAPRGDQPPDMEKLLAIAKKYGLKIVAPQ